MTRQQHGLGMALAVAAFCIGLLLLVLGLLFRNGAEDDSAAIGFPVVLGGVIVLATLFAVGWRAMSKRSHSDH